MASVAGTNSAVLLLRATWPSFRELQKIGCEMSPSRRIITKAPVAPPLYEIDIEASGVSYSSNWSFSEGEMFGDSQHCDAMLVLYFYQTAVVR